MYSISYSSNMHCGTSSESSASSTISAADVSRRRGADACGAAAASTASSATAEGAASSRWRAVGSVHDSAGRCPSVSTEGEQLQRQ
eukprot:CAMPEP_0173176728 /NCGR_PEP_ID=MMETSP1141-20130122/4621_1 /TAXON_ID=483371 /ORGANISM="non described non described, Strain CCMP2298" /LENGTH=85 /DNA_ID=CAMNT_0014099099 /DNA_START=2202 /DNA_END=2459 /DNA_ORIENTATION=+